MLFSLIDLVHWISLHGPFVLFFLLALGIIGLPIPDETLLVISGTLIRNDILALPLTTILVVLGTMTGITVSYILGRLLNQAIIQSLFSKFKVKTHHWNRMEKWYKRYGKWSLTIGYFIPGVRHFTGIFSGLLGLPYKQFAMYAYLGAVLWSLFFLALGFFFGNQALATIHLLFEKYGYGLTLLFVFIVFGFLAYSYKFFSKKQDSLKPHE